MLFVGILQTKMRLMHIFYRYILLNSIPNRECHVYWELIIIQNSWILVDISRFLCFDSLTILLYLCLSLFVRVNPYSGHILQGCLHIIEEQWDLYFWCCLCLFWTCWGNYPLHSSNNMFTLLLVLYIKKMSNVSFDAACFMRFDFWHCWTKICTSSSPCIFDRSISLLSSRCWERGQLSQYMGLISIRVFRM